MGRLYVAWTNGKIVRDDKVEKFLRYVVKNQKYLIHVGNFVFDSKSLSKKIMLSRCTMCERYQRSDCCGGNSYSMTGENIKKLKSCAEEALREISNEYNNTKERLESFYKHGCVTKGGATTVRGNGEGRCIFSVRDGESTKCAVHGWCIEKNINPMEYKPYICSLFPIEGIVTPNGKIVVFCSDKDTQQFSMYSYTLTQRICVNEENLIKVMSGDVGRSKYLRSVNAENVISDNIIKDYRPAYIEAEKALRFFCGDDVYEGFLLKMRS